MALSALVMASTAVLLSVGKATAPIDTVTCTLSPPGVATGLSRSDCSTRSAASCAAYSLTAAKQAPKQSPPGRPTKPAAGRQADGRASGRERVCPDEWNPVVA